MARIEYGIRVLAWQKTAGGHENRNPPEPLSPPSADIREAGELDELDARARAYLERTGTS
jgi:hypothetical protein